MLKRASPLHYYLYFAMTFLKMRPSILQRMFLDVLFLAVTGSKCWPGEFGQSFVEKQAQLEGGGRDTSASAHCYIQKIASNG